MRYLSAVMLSVLAVSCNRSGDEVSRFHEDGRAKPAVAVASMIDTTSFDAPWSLSEELTTMISNQLSLGGLIYVQSQEELPFSENPFSGGDLSWMKREFQGKEFVIFLELVEHEAVPASKTKNIVTPHEVSTNLNMAIRLRVVDLRNETPKIVLQEMIRDSYFIPKTLIPTDYSRVVWGTEDYRKSPMGIAHAQIVQEITTRISDYILLAKSR
ncbi:MAG TPA: CT253 family lipoprotein [Chlamydiales bacterium]|nr:CT253 family lipoprotein [Chlamydiales bacterium]